MTAAELAHLSELAESSAFIFASSDLVAARKFGEASLRADALSIELRRSEEQARQVLSVTEARFPTAREPAL